MIELKTLLEYYAEMGINEAQVRALNEELKVDSFSGMTVKVHSRRLRSLNEAKGDNWDHGPPMAEEEIKHDLNRFHMEMSAWNRSFSEVYRIGNFSIGVARPGKEAATDYALITHYKHCSCNDCSSGNRVKNVNNPHDMFPFVRTNNVLMSVKRRRLKDGRIKVTPWTFEHLFNMIETSYDEPKMQLALELLGSILVRASFMLDHKKDKAGNLRLILPEIATQEMVDRLPRLGEEEWSVPTEAVIFFIDILGVNEEVKVDVKGYRELQRVYAKGPKPQDNGRTNTLLTFSHMLAAILHRRPIGEFAYGLHRGLGMNPMSSGKIHSVYPLLSSDIDQLLNLDITELGWSP